MHECSANLVSEEGVLPDVGRYALVDLGLATSRAVAVASLSGRADMLWLRLSSCISSCSASAAEASSENPANQSFRSPR